MENLSDKPLPELSPEVLGFIPLFYVAWSDTVLSPTEISFIHEKLKNYNFLKDSDKEYLLSHTDPSIPPSHEVFRQWGGLLKIAAKQLPDSQKMNLVELGMEMAYQGTAKKLKKHIERPEILDALRDLHSALGLSYESESLMTGFLHGEKERVSEPGYGYDSNIMKSLLDDDTIEVKDRMRQLLRDPAFAVKFVPDKESHRAITLERLKMLARQGLSGYSFPEKYGGSGRYSDYLAVFEMLGYTDLSLAIKFGVQYGLFGGAVYQLGTEWHHKTFLSDMIKGDLLGCFAMTETGHGSNVKNLETTATYNHADKTLSINSPNFESSKEYIGNALHAHYAVVFAQLHIEGEAHGVNAIIVPIRNKKGQVLDGIRVEDNGYKMGLNGVDNGRIWFDNVKVPVRNLLDKYAQIDEEGKFSSPIKSESKRFFTMLGALVAGRIAVGLLGNNTSKKALTIALRYALKRRQFAPKDGMKETLIIDYPSHQKRLFPLLARSYAYAFALNDLAKSYVSEGEKDHRKTETLAAGLKAKASWHATRTIQECREACGGKGYLVENILPSLKADTDIFTTFEGDNTVLMQLVAKGVLTDFKQSFHDDGYIAILRYLLTKIRHDAYELNPFSRRNTDASHLQSEEFHRHAFRYRYKKTLITLSERMQKYLKRGMNSYNAFLKVQLHTIDLADAYIDELVLDAFYKRLQMCEDEKIRLALERLLQVYALSVIEENKGWFLETDYMDGSKTKAIRRVLAKLYRDMRPDIRAYMDSFAIPDELLGAEIVRD